VQLVMIGMMAIYLKCSGNLDYGVQETVVRRIELNIWREDEFEKSRMRRTASPTYVRNNAPPGRNLQSPGRNLQSPGMEISSPIRMPGDMLHTKHTLIPILRPENEAGPMLIQQQQQQPQQLRQQQRQFSEPVTSVTSRSGMRMNSVPYGYPEGHTGPPRRALATVQETPNRSYQYATSPPAGGNVVPMVGSSGLYQRIPPAVPEHLLRKQSYPINSRATYSRPPPLPPILSAERPPPANLPSFDSQKEQFLGGSFGHGISFHPTTPIDQATPNSQVLSPSSSTSEFPIIKLSAPPIRNTVMMAPRAPNADYLDSPTIPRPISAVSDASEQSVYVYDMYRDYYSRSPPGNINYTSIMSTSDNTPDSQHEWLGKKVNYSPSTPAHVTVLHGEYDLQRSPEPLRKAVSLDEFGKSKNPQRQLEGRSEVGSSSAGGSGSVPVIMVNDQEKDIEDVIVVKKPAKENPNGW